MHSFFFISRRKREPGPTEKEMVGVQSAALPIADEDEDVPYSTLPRYTRTLPEPKPQTRKKRVVPNPQIEHDATGLYAKPNKQKTPKKQPEHDITGLYALPDKKRNSKNENDELYQNIPAKTGGVYGFARPFESDDTKRHSDYWNHATDGNPGQNDIGYDVIKDRTAANRQNGAFRDEDALYQNIPDSPPSYSNPALVNDEDEVKMVYNDLYGFVKK